MKKEPKPVEPKIVPSPIENIVTPSSEEAVPSEMTPEPSVESNPDDFSDAPPSVDPPMEAK